MSLFAALLMVSKSPLLSLRVTWAPKLWNPMPHFTLLSYGFFLLIPWYCYSNLLNMCFYLGDFSLFLVQLFLIVNHVVTLILKGAAQTNEVIDSLSLASNM